MDVNIVNQTLIAYTKADDAGVAKVFLYGPIGDNWWLDEEDKTDDKTIAKAIAALDQDPIVTKIQIRINSPGGSVRHSDAIISAIKNCSKPVETHNDGQAYSAAADIWMAAAKENRFMSDHAKMMIHCTIGGAWGNAQDLRAAAEVLDIYDKAACGILCEATGLSEEDAMAKFYDYKDHWLLKKDCIEAGLLNGDSQTALTTEKTGDDITDNYKPERPDISSKIKAEIELVDDATNKQEQQKTISQLLELEFNFLTL